MKCNLSIYLVLFSISAMAQTYPEWKVYNTSNSFIPDDVILSLYVDNDKIKWIGTRNGLAKYNDTSWTVYNTFNSGLSHNSINGITEDNDGKLWLATAWGVSVFDKISTWTTYYSTTSTLPNNNIQGITTDTSGNIWVATYGGGPAKFNGTNWISFFPQGSLSIARDKYNNIWIGADSLWKYDGITWEPILTTPSGVYDVCADTNGNIWTSLSAVGLGKYNGNTWTIYNNSNSGLPNNNVTFINVDTKNNIWITTNNGTAVFDGNSSWKVYKTGNSGIPENIGLSIAFETCNKNTISAWIGCTLGTNGGLASFSQIYYPACMVTTDSGSVKNVIVWEKNVSSAVDSFRIYKETSSAGVYNVIGTVDYSQLSTFEDTASNILQQAYRYKIGAVTLCGQETISKEHKTMHLTVNAGSGGSWNLIWDAYEGFNYGTINIWRGTLPGNMIKIGSVPSTNFTFSDLSPPAGDLLYRLEIVHPNGCTPTAKNNNISTILSNIAKTATITSIQDNIILNQYVNVYPVPSSGNVSIKFAFPQNQTTLLIRNVNGQTIYESNISTTDPDHIYSIEMMKFQKGIYFISIYNEKGVLNDKIIIY